MPDEGWKWDPEALAALLRQMKTQKEAVGERRRAAHVDANNPFHRDLVDSVLLDFQRVEYCVEACEYEGVVRCIATDQKGDAVFVGGGYAHVERYGIVRVFFRHELN